MVAVLGIAASTQAGIATEFTVDDGANILDGAVFATSIDGADTWTESVGSPGVFGAVGSNASLTISAASGAGAVWNGVYTRYDATGGAAPFVGAYQDSGSSYGTLGLTADQGGAATYWEDGAGNQLYFLVVMNAGATAASDGAAVVQDNFGSYNSAFLSSVGGANPGFSDPTGGIGSVSVIPEPGTISLMSLSTVGLFLTRTIRRRKRIGGSVMPIRSVPLCDSFLSEQDWRCETVDVEEVTEENGLFTQLSESINQQMVRVSTTYRAIEKTFWNRMVQRYENRLERRQNRVLLLKKNTIRRLDEFLALIMK